MNEQNTKVTNNIKTISIIANHAGIVSNTREKETLSLRTFANIYKFS